MNNKEKKRLRAIKLRYVFFKTKCECCGKEYVKEKMWHCWRYGVNETLHKWHYCQNCMHSAEEVLNEIDTDEFNFGLAGIDDFKVFRKKDYARMNLANEKAFGKIPRIPK